MSPEDVKKSDPVALGRPLWFCPLVDVAVVKDRRGLGEFALGAGRTCAAVVAYIVFYASFTTWNHARTGCYVYPWMYDIDASGAGAAGHAAYYGGLSVPVCAAVLRVRRAVVPRAEKEA